MVRKEAHASEQRTRDSFVMSVNRVYVCALCRRRKPSKSKRKLKKKDVRRRRKRLRKLWKSKKTFKYILLHGHIFLFTDDHTVSLRLEGLLFTAAARYGFAS